jgi:hypothetical protein
MLAVCSCFIRKCDRFEVIRDFRWLKKSDVTIQFLVFGLAIHFAGIFYLVPFKKLCKNFILVQWLKIFQILGANITPKLFFASLDTSKRHFLEKTRVN